LHNEKLHVFYSTPVVIQVVKDDEMGGECGMYKEEEKCLQGSDGET